MPYVDKGNPNVFTTFRGKYKLELAEGVTSSNQNVMLTCTNIVQFLGNFTANESGEIGTLPEGCRPFTVVYVPCYCASNRTVEYVMVTPTGKVTGKSGYLYYMTGCLFNISGNYY